MKKIIPVVFLTASVLLLGCQKDVEPNSITCSNITGWVGNGHEFVYVNYPVYIMADSLYITLEEVSSNVFRNTSIYDDGTLYPTISSFLQPCDNIIYQSAAADMNNKQEAYRVDGNVGDSWATTVTSAGGVSVTTTTTIIAKDVSVTVPAGTFNTIHLESVSVAANNPGSPIETNIYLNNTAGPVKAIGTTVHYELARKNF